MFKGIVKVEKYVPGDRDRTIESFTVENKITKRTAERLFLDNLAVFTDDLRIAISTDVLSASYERISVDNIIVIGSTVDVSGRVFTEEIGVDPRNVTYQNRFLPPSSPRSFSTIAIVTGTTNNDTASITADTWAYVSFGTPVDQSGVEQIDVTYKVFLDWDSAPVNLPSTFQDALQYLLLDELLPLDYDANLLSTVVYSGSNPDYALRSRAIQGSEFLATSNIRTDILKLEYQATVTFPADSYVNGLLHGQLERTGSNLDQFKGLGGFVEIFPTAGTIGSVFSHNETTDAVFDDPGNKANSDWQPVITDVTNEDTILPSLYSLRVESSGGLGSGAYSIYHTTYLGGDDSITWNQEPKFIVATQKYPYFVDDDNDIPYHNKWIYRWTSDRFWVSGNDNVVAIWQIFPEFVIDNSYDLASSNSVTRINDIATDPSNDKIYVATEEGLFEIVVGGAITQLSSDRAMAVDVGNGGEVFAYLINTGVGRLASSLNATWADAHDLTGATITPENVLFIRCDRDSTDYNLAILELGFVAPDSVAGDFGGHNNEAFAYIHWWNNASNFASTLDLEVRVSTSMYFSRFTLFPFNSSFTVDSGIWVFPKYVTNQNLTQLSSTRGYPRELVRQLEALGTEVVDADGELVFTSNVALPTRIVVGAAQFNQEIRVSTYTSSGNFTFNQAGFPSYAILDGDISGGTLSVCLGGYHGVYSQNAAYNESSHLRFAGGCFDFSVSTGTPTINGYTAYKGEAINKYTLSSIFSSSAQQKGSANYALGGNVIKGQKGGILCFNDSSASSGTRELAGGNQFVSTHFHPIAIAAWGAPDKTGMFTYPGWSTRYGWNSGSSQWEESLVLGGKPLHTASEAAPQGLEIGWQDLDLGSTNDLIIDQHYEFTRCEKGFISDGTYPSATVKWNYYQRPVVLYSLSETIPGAPYQITLAPASSDPLWLTLDGADSSDIKIAIAGYSDNATIIFTGSPAANEVLVSDAVAGILEFNSADETKAVTGTVLYMQKIDSTEVL
ncbi:hypothetical protein Xen7305DRAFT_00009090 [Xenococcus sp. PCC 7305]|uniref:hypothetical protein n=1 Tax=Xenococcus sp. PCC 7305 TaxID=102125 RepID=UPI0002ABBDD4|nr:hypothetical protein [Xenococcus sp. PCC 7305]ELS01207.1 hypothetical protein Xen7305DRAFT_00009090 [Xenococcus sp. PCC 7305]